VLTESAAGYVPLHLRDLTPPRPPIEPVDEAEYAAAVAVPACFR
jgi:hypothetical protein